MNLETPFSLVLSGGGALGIAHLGVIADMEERGMAPSEVVGTSMGGIIGACVAIGMKESDIYDAVARFGSVTNWLKLSFSGNAIVEHDKIAEIFTRLFGKRMMGDTLIPLKLVATELLTGEKRVFSGADDVRLVDALLATMAIPGIFEEPEIEGKVYGDGFLCANLAVDDAAYEHVLAVDVLGAGSFDKTLPNHRLKTKNVLLMMERSMRLLIYHQTQKTLACTDKKVHYIDIPTAGFKTFQFHKHEALRALGRGLL